MEVELLTEKYFEQMQNNLWRATRRDIKHSIQDDESFGLAFDGLLREIDSTNGSLAKDKVSAWTERIRTFVKVFQQVAHDKRPYAALLWQAFFAALQFSFSMPKLRERSLDQIQFFDAVMPNFERPADLYNTNDSNLRFKLLMQMVNLYESYIRFYTKLIQFISESPKGSRLRSRTNFTKEVKKALESTRNQASVNARAFEREADDIQRRLAEEKGIAERKASQDPRRLMTFTSQSPAAEPGTRENLKYLEKLAKFHQERSTNLNRFATVDNSPLDLYRLRKAIQARGGFDEVCEMEKWAEIGRDLGYSGDIMSSLSASLKESYLTWLQPYEEYLRQSEEQQHLDREHGIPDTPSNPSLMLEKPTSFDNTTFHINSAPFPRTAGFTDSGYGSYARGKAVTQRLAMDADPNPNPIYGRGDSCDGLIANLESISFNDSIYKKLETGSDQQHLDDASIFSATSTFPDSVRDCYVAALAEDISKAIAPKLASEDGVEQIYSVLPRLLKGLSLSLGNQPGSQMHRDVMFFIRKYRRNIAASCRDILLENAPPWDGRDTSEKMTLEEKMRLWQGNSEEMEIPCELSFPKYLEDLSEGTNSEDELPDLPGIQEYKDLVLSAPAYAKLLSDLRRACILAPGEPNIIEEIHDTISQILPVSKRVSRRRPSERLSMTFKVDWDPLSFLKEQKYSQPPEIALETAIVLTGSATTAQALTCAEYLKQTWPSIGIDVIRLIQNVVKYDHTATSSVKLLDNTLVNALLHFNEEEMACLYVCVEGLPSWIAEIGEILAWMGSALQSSPYRDQVAYSRPFVQQETDTDTSPFPCDYACTIRFTTTHCVESSQTSTDGCCWHNLFRNALIVEGYPTARRSTPNPGLEIPLTMMAGLAQTCRIQPFAGNLFIKGFSTMLVPTDYSNNVIMWHLIFDKDGNRISYIDGVKHSKVKIQMSELQTSRHILGWCSEMKFYAGAHDVSYNVQNSRLPRVSGNSLLFNRSISMGQILTGGVAFSIGQKDTPVYVTRNGYVWKLKWLAKKFVLLWDEEDKRGWLVNGTSALLHLVCTSLEQDKMSEFSSATLFDLMKLQYHHPHQPNSAARTLVNKTNMHLATYEGDDNMRFQDHVTHFYELMEKMMDYQLAAMDGNLNLCTSRSRLEGWDFDDLAAGRDPIYAREAKLDATGMSWVDLTRSVHSVTFFGRGFGDLIRPVNTCSKWATLPTGQSYLAVCHADLLEIVKTYCGDLHSTPVRLTDQIVWYIPEEVSVECQCKNGKGGAHSDVAQVLLPSSLTSQLPPQGHRIKHTNSGALIFGYNSVHHWYWPDLGEPLREPIQYARQTSSSLSRDSGIGNSLNSSASVDGDSGFELNTNQYSGEQSSELPDPLPTFPSRQARISPCLMTADFTVGIICARHKELMAVRMLFDSIYENVSFSARDMNSYAFGSMGKHNIVATCLPDGEYGTNSAADVASNMNRTFDNLRFCLLVGIGGGVPSARNDIRLGDVVVSTPLGTGVGVLQYDMKKTLEQGQSQMNGYLQPPPRPLRSVLSEMQSDRRLADAPLQPYLQQIGDLNEGYGYLGQDNDILYASDYPHPGHSDNDTCDGCDISKVQVRPARMSNQPRIHYGMIASGNQVMKDAKTRDELGRKHNVLCFEMEAAGIMNIMPSLVIRGICDYCDSHKNKKWQEYAAATAAAFAKLLLSRVRPETESEYRPRSLNQYVRVGELGDDQVHLHRRESFADELDVKRRRIYGPSLGLPSS